ncbi:MAG: hypothetical protein GY752_08705 [bacterium]|nr:hypothetical protein [bacterium]MCP4800794.1 hypothetical protein [bacterium]
MKCKSLLMLFLLIAIPATLMGGHLRAYFDECGTITEFTTEELFVEVYIIVFVEAEVQGVAYQLELSSENLELIAATYPPGLALGDPMNGVELGMCEDCCGLWGCPILVTTLVFLNHNTSPTYLTTTNHENYETIVYADPTGELFPLSSRTSVFGTPVANENMSWGAVKNLFR